MKLPEWVWYLLLPYSFGLFCGVAITGLLMFWRYNLW